MYDGSQVRGAWISPTKLGMKADLVEGWDPACAKPNISLSDSPDEQLQVATNVNPETILAKSGGLGTKGGL